jgi:hypothetical protein
MWRALSPVWKDWAVLLISLANVGEAVTLHAHGSQHLWYWTLCGWIHAFVSAVLLQLLDLGRDNPLRTCSDIAARVLPTPLSPGDSGKIVLGVPTNIRRHLLWGVLLGLGVAFNVAFNVAGIIASMLFLAREPAVITSVWIGFQGLWLLSRIVVFYFVEGAASGRQGVTLSRAWEDSNGRDRRCVMVPLSEMSKPQVSIHPRGAHAYRHDCLSLEELSSQFAQASWTLTPALPAVNILVLRKGHKLDVGIVVGDTLIRIVVWFKGVTNLSNSDLYDACFAFIPCPQGKGTQAQNSIATSTIAAVPCVRAFACSCSRVDLQQHSRTDCAQLLEWLYFIPSTRRQERGGLDVRARPGHSDQRRVPV